MGGVVGESVTSTVYLPPFDSSAMDGYAVRVEDLKQVPQLLTLAGSTAAGDPPGNRLRPGECSRIFTGAPLPPGADAVVMQEDVNIGLEPSDQIQIRETVRPWENIRFRGEDISLGDSLLAPGTVVQPQHLGLLAACGHQTVRIHRRPQVAVLANGSELREAGELLAPGQIFESNRVMLAGLIASAGALPETLSLVEDDLSKLQFALAMAVERFDLVVTVGGASVGEGDLVKAAVRGLGGSVDFWKIAIRPGKPFFLGQIGSKLVLGLPGNPVSAYVTAILLVLPAVRRLRGMVQCNPPETAGILAEPMVNAGDRDHYARVLFGPDGMVRNAGLQASHRMASLAASNAILKIPAGTTLARGTPVSAICV